MKTIFLSIAVILFLSNCIQTTRSSDHLHGHVQESSKANPSALGSLFTLSEAEKILGEPAYLCSYKASKTDSATAKTGAIYFLIEQFAQVTSAQEKYSFIKKANEGHDGIKVLNDYGDEAYYHSDGENFYFIMVRRGAKVFNMKVNKITTNTSLDQFNAIARQITGSI